MFGWPNALALSLCLALWQIPAFADDVPAAHERATALGFNVDLFPTVISAVNGKAG